MKQVVIKNKFIEDRKLFSNSTIPNDWEISTVGEAFEICNNLRFPINEEERRKIQGTYPYYGPTKIQDYIKEYRLDGKYVLIGEDGDHFLKWKELPMTLLVEGKFNVNNHAHVIKGTTNITEWFFYYFNHKELTPYLTRQGAGRYKLTKQSLEKIPVPLPSISEQKAITTILSSCDLNIKLIEQLLTLKELRKKWLMQQLLTGTKRLNGFNGKWDEKQLKKLCKIYKGEQLNKIELEKTGKYPSYSGGITPSGYTDGWNTHENTIIISEGGNSCGYVNFITTKFWCGGHCYALLNLSHSVDRNFFFQILKFNESRIMKLRVGSGLPNIQKGDVENFSVEIPPIEEQTAIAQVLQASDKEISLLKVKAEKLRVNKKGLMQQLLTGKIRIK